MNFDFHDRDIDFVKHRNKFFVLSSAFTLIGIILLLTLGLNLGIDFESGSRVEVVAPDTLTADQVREEFSKSVRAMPQMISRLLVIIMKELVSDLLVY